MPFNQTKRLKILLGCYACDPNFGSEPGMGWNFVKNIAKFHDIHAIIEKNEFEENLKQYAKQHPEEVENITFHFIPRTHHNILRKIWPPSYYWFYRKWQKKAYKYALELDKTENFDIIHQLTLAGFREPGYLWKINKPFIWGPIGGLNQTYWHLLPYMGLYGTIFYTLRNIINYFHKRWSKAARIVSQKAHTILISDPKAEKEIQKIWNRTPVIMREVGITSISTFNNLTNHEYNKPLRVCWAGVHEPRKGLPILIQAVALCKHSIQLDVLGTGSCTNKWKKYAKQIGVADKFIFHGSIPHQNVFSIMSKCHAFCITSISEGGTTSIVLEAMQHGLPIVALDNCAYASVINEHSGIKIALGSRKNITKQLAEALDLLATNESLRAKLSKGALERGKDFLWATKALELNEIYLRAATC